MRRRLSYILFNLQLNQNDYNRLPTKEGHPRLLPLEIVESAKHTSQNHHSLHIQTLNQFQNRVETLFTLEAIKHLITKRQQNM